MAGTLKVLLTNPGQLTEEFLAGHRTRGLSPLSLCLMCSTAYFLAGPLVDRALGSDASPVTAIPRSPAGRGAAPTDSDRVVLTAEARDALEQLGASQVLGRERFDRITNDLEGLTRALGRVLLGATPLVMFTLLPMFAFLTWLAWRGSGQRYPAHLNFALHLHAAWFASMVPAQLAPLMRNAALAVVVGLAVVVYDTWYAIVAIKRVLGGTPGQLVIRSGIVGVVYGACLLVAMFAVLAYTVLNY